MSYKRKLLTIGSTVMLTAGLVTLTQLDAQKVEAREEVGEEQSIVLEGTTSQGYELEVSFGKGQHSFDYVGDKISIFVKTLDNGKLDGKKVTLKLANGQEFTSTLNGRGAEFWNTAEIKKGEIVTVIIGDDESNKVEMTAKTTIKGTYNNNVDFNLTTPEGQKITITSITNDYICGYADFIGENMWLYLETPDGERTIYSKDKEHNSFNTFSFDNHLNIKKGDTIKIGYYKLSENPPKLTPNSSFNSPDFSENFVTFKAPKDATGTNFYNETIEFDVERYKKNGSEYFLGRATKINSNFIEGQVDPSYAGSIIDFYMRNSAYTISEATSSLVDENGKFTVLNNVWFDYVGAVATLTLPDGTRKSADFWPTKEIVANMKDKWNHYARFDMMTTWVYLPENIEAPTYDDSDEFYPSAEFVIKKNEITIKDIKDAISIKDYNKGYTIEVDETTIPKLTDGNKEVAGKVKATVIYADKSTDEVEVTVLLTSKTDAEIYTTVKCGPHSSGVFSKPITKENLNPSVILGEIAGQSLLYEGKRSFEIDESTIPVLPPHSKESVKGKVKITVTYEDGSIGDVYTEVEIMPSQWDMLDLTPLWDDTDTLVKNAVFNENEETITGQFIIADADILVRSFNGQFRGPVYEAHTDENGHFTLENATFVDSYSVTLKIDGEQTRISGSFIVKSDDGNGGETTDPEKPVDPDNGNGGETTEPEKPVDPDNGNGGETTDPEKPVDPDNGNGGETTEPEKPVDPDNGGETDNGNGGETKPDPEVKPEVKPEPVKPEPKPENKPNSWAKSANGQWARYDANGNKATNWLQEGNNWYFFDENGVMQTGWVRVNGKWYSLRENGQMKRGWEVIDGKHYFFRENGEMAQSEWIPYGEDWYYMKASGAMAQNEWEPYNGAWYYFKADGKMAKNEVINGYKVDASGRAI